MGNEKLLGNIKILEQGISLQQFEKMQEQLSVDRSMDAGYQ